MERFVETWEAGSRFKLPPSVTAKQRKAVHLWAEERGLEHRSFGWSSRRRLHLSIPGVRNGAVAGSGEVPADQDAEFDWNAWADNDDEDQSDYESDNENDW